MGWFTTLEEDRAAAHAREVQDAHNKGQTDASNDKCELPIGAIAELINDKTMEQNREINDAYLAGHSHGESQK